MVEREVQKDRFNAGIRRTTKGDESDGIDSETRLVIRANEETPDKHILSHDVQKRAEEHKEVLQPAIDTATIRFITGWLFPHLDKGLPLTYDDYNRLVFSFRKDQEMFFDVEQSLIGDYRLSDRAMELLEGAHSNSDFVQSLQAEKILNPTKFKNHRDSFTQLYENDSRLRLL